MYNHNKAQQSKTVCIFLGIYCKSQCVVTPESCRSVVAVYLQCNSRDCTTNAQQMYSNSNAAITRLMTWFAKPKQTCRISTALQVNERQNAQHRYCEHTMTAMRMATITCWAIKKAGSFCGYDWISLDSFGFYAFFVKTDNRYFLLNE